MNEYEMTYDNMHLVSGICSCCEEESDELTDSGVCIDCIEEQRFYDMTMGGLK